MFIIYTKEKISKIKFEVPMSKEDVEKLAGGNVFQDHPELNKDDYVVSEERFSYPTYDQLSNTIKEMTLFERYQNNLYVLSQNEVIYENDILVLEPGEYIDEYGVKQTVPKIEGTRVEWNWETHVWEEKATELEIIQAQYSEYKGMDTPSTIEEMKQQDPALATEFVNMLIELRQLAYSLNSSLQSTGFSAIRIPQPSKALKEFLEKRKTIQ